MLKRLLKVFSFIIITITLLFISDNSVYAFSTEIKNINEPILTINVSDLQFINISYKDWSNTSTKAFGLSGLIYNNSDTECSFNSTVTYYDLNNNIVAISNHNQTIESREYSAYNQMSNLSLIGNGYSINDITYYKLDIEIISNNNDKPVTNTVGNGQYAITKYNINMTVNENNTFDIDEQITAYFNVEKHGIFRFLPLKNTINRVDGTTSNNRATITNVTVNNNFQTYKENGNFVIKIGSVNSTFIGAQSYNIMYNYNIGKDPIKDYDELYFNLIGTNWDTTISNFTFNITMPKEFDSSKLGFSLGNLGSTNSNDIKYTVNGNVITGSCNRVINPKEALTVRLELPEGYFVGASNGRTDIPIYLIFMIPFIFVIISFLIWRKTGKDDQVIETVEFYPPEGFNSLEIGYLYKGHATNKDVISLLIYLANKGYIKISEMEEKKLFSTKKGFKITKLKEYDGDDFNERMFLNGLFSLYIKLKSVGIISLFKTQSTLDKELKQNDNEIIEVTSTELYNNFYLTMNQILTNVNNKSNKNKIFEKIASWKKVCIILMIIITYCVITIPPIIEYGDTLIYLLPFALLFPGIGFTIMFATLFGGVKTVYVNGRATSSAILPILFGLIWGGLFGGLPWLTIVFPILLQDKIYLAGYIVGLICVMIMIICFQHLSKRTSYGKQMLGKIRGFKRFLETSEKQNLESLVMKDPQYFYNILPYTYVLGVSDKWIKKFETIALQSPNWYDSSTVFNVSTFGMFMNNTMSSASKVMSSVPSSSGSSGGSFGSSGGGSSGGGSGGGGGGSW